jgi:uncharacterized Zn-finger protein
MERSQTSAQTSAQTPVETEVVDTATVACGGGGALGHPKVYLNIGSDGQVACPYCSRRYVLAETARQA